MRRKENEITDEHQIESIIERSPVFRLGLSDGNSPYVVPLNFGYKNRTLYFHGTDAGKKIDIIKKNPNVCVEFDVDVELVPSDDPCKWSVKYQSVIGFGKADIITGEEEKRTALGIIMDHYTDGPHTFSDKSVKNTTLIKVVLDSLTGKQSVK